MMAGLKNSYYGFAYAFDSEERDYVLNITNAVADAILVHNEVTGMIKFDLIDALDSVPTFASTFKKINRQGPKRKEKKHISYFQI